MVHSDPMIEWCYTLRAHKIKIRRKSNIPYKMEKSLGFMMERECWDVMANILHSCQGRQAAKTAVYLVGGSSYLKWHPVHTHKEHAHQVTALHLACLWLLRTILATLLNYCSMLVARVHVPRWHSHLEKHHCT